MKWWLALLLLLLGTSANSLVVVRLPFDELVKRASVVFIGTVERIQPVVHSQDSTHATVKVESLLKGTAPAVICLLTRPPFPESNFEVTAGRRYLFLLTQYDDCYVSVNGSAAVSPVDGKPHESFSLGAVPGVTAPPSQIGFN
jgi:hypothetical protein